MSRVEVLRTPAMMDQQICFNDANTLQQRDPSLMTLGQNDSHKRNRANEILPQTNGLIIPPTQSLPYPLPRKSSLGGLAYLKKVCFQNPAVQPPSPPAVQKPPIVQKPPVEPRSKSTSDILQRLDNVRRLQQTVFQELQELMTMQEESAPASDSTDGGYQPSQMQIR